MHLSSATLRGGGAGGEDPALMWGIFFLQSPQYLAKPSTQLATELYFGSLNSYQTLTENYFSLNTFRTDEKQGENTLSWWFIAYSKQNVLKFPEYSERFL